MSEITFDLRALPKHQAYRELAGHIDAVLFGIDDEIAEMATAMFNDSSVSRSTALACI